MVQVIRENGFTNNSGVFISGDEVKKSVKRWREYGWFDYEMKKAKKLAGKAGLTVTRKTSVKAVKRELRKKA